LTTKQYRKMSGRGVNEYCRLYTWYCTNQLDIQYYTSTSRCEMWMQQNKKSSRCEYEFMTYLSCRWATIFHQYIVCKFLCLAFQILCACLVWRRKKSSLIELSLKELILVKSELNKIDSCLDTFSKSDFLPIFIVWIV
jgi:hypothetical protein